MAVKLPLKYHPTLVFQYGLEGTAEDAKAVMEFAPGDPLRAIQRAAIRWWLESKSYYLNGKVMDFGCGRPRTCRTPEPYRDLVTGEYVGIDKGDEPPIGPATFDAILCTEVLMYLPEPSQHLEWFASMLREGGHLVLTFTAAWPEIEPESLWRFTAAGMAHLLEQAGFVVVEEQPLSQLVVGANILTLGHAAIARKR